MLAPARLRLPRQGQSPVRFNQRGEARCVINIERPRTGRDAGADRDIVAVTVRESPPDHRRVCSGVVKSTKGGGLFAARLARKDSQALRGEFEGGVKHPALPDERLMLAN